MSKLSDIVGDPPKNKRPRVTSVKVKSKGVFDEATAEEATIAYYTEEQNYSEYAESLSTIVSISISYEGNPVAIPLGEFSQTTTPNQGFEEQINPETIVALHDLRSGVHNVTLSITYNEDPLIETFEVPMTFSL